MTHALVTAQHTWIFKRESTAFVACWLYDATDDDDDSANGLSLVSWSDVIWLDVDGRLLLPLLLPANNVRAHELDLVVDDGDEEEFGIGRIWGLA